MDNEIPRLKTWRTIRKQRPLNEESMAVYKRLMDAEVRLDALRRRRGVSDVALGDALVASEAENEHDVYVSTLVRYVAELGGHLEVLAVFPDETVTLLEEPTSR